jgi:hypothetical protein
MAKTPRYAHLIAVTRLLVDHENSPLHGKIYLTLNPSASTAVSDLK